MPSTSPYRDGLVGFTLSGDRLFIIHTPEFSAGITEYNDELTGFDKRLGELDPKVFHYGGNAYYILGQYCKDRGWRVESIEDRF